MSRISVSDTLPGVHTSYKRGIFSVTTTAPVVPAITLINGFSTGVDAPNRIGRQVQLKFMEFRIYAIGTATSLSDVVRVSLIFDLQPSSAIPAITDIYQNTSIQSLMSYNSAPRFRVIKEWFLLLGGLTSPLTGTISPLNLLHTEVVPLDIPTEYQGTGGSITDISRGALYLAYQSANGSAVIGYQAAVYFDDQ